MSDAGTSHTRNTVAIDVVAVVDNISFCINSSGNNLKMGKKSGIRRIKIGKHGFRTFIENIHYTLNNVMSASVDHMRYESENTCIRYIYRCEYGAYGDLIKP